MTARTEDGFSVVTPTRGRVASLLRTLDGLTVQDYPPELIEVIVVFDGPDPDGVAALGRRTYPFSLRVLEQPVGGPASARNHALTAAGAPFVLFLDDDVIPDRRLLAEHRATHDSDPDVVVIGPLLAPEAAGAAPWTVWEWRTLAEQYRAMSEGLWPPTPRQFYTGNASVRREHLLAVGGFNERFARGEDVELAWRLERRGLRFAFQPAAKGRHLARRSFRAWLGAAFEYGRTDVTLERIRTGDGDIPPWVLREFRLRHSSTKRVTLLALRHRWLISAARLAGGPMVRAAAAVAGKRWGHGACSALFTMTYWAGVADRLGDRGRVLRMLTGVEQLTDSLKPACEVGLDLAGVPAKRGNPS